MSILWEPSGETGEPIRDVRGVQLGAQEWQKSHGVSPQSVGAPHCRDAEDAPAGDKLIALVIGAVSGGMVGLVLGYALGVL